LAIFEMPPYSGENLLNGGLAVDITRQAYIANGWTLIVEEFPTLRASRIANAGNVDGFVLATTNFPADDFHTSDPFIKSEIVFVAHSDQEVIYESLASFSGELIGTVSGWGIEDTFSQLTWQVVESPKQLLAMLKYGRIYSFLYDSIALKYALKRYFPNETGDFQVLEPIVTPVEWGIAIANTNPDAEEKIRAFNAGLKTMKEDGSLQRTINRHLGEQN
jgi:ABC-type amino acid transport substrate-binding protein